MQPVRRSSSSESTTKSLPHGQKSVTVSGLARGFIHSAVLLDGSTILRYVMSPLIFIKMANNEGFFRQMYNASLGDLLWRGSKSLRSKKRKASSDFYAVERVISKRKVQNAVGNVNKVYLNLWIYAIACMHL